MKQSHLFISPILLAVVLVLSAIVPGKAIALDKTSRASAMLVSAQITSVKDYRAKALRVYLERHDSPLAPYAYVFVSEADKNQIDWKMVAAISGVESTFGKRIPYNSYNGWGWGVYGNNVLYFTSWDEAIITISGALREKYINKMGASDIYSIGRIYAADPAWANKVTFFMHEIGEFEQEYSGYELSISI